MKIWEKLCNFIVLYRSPSQSQDDFETFLKKFELNLDTILANDPFLTVVLGDFNFKSDLWCKSDKTSYEGSKIEGITSQFGLQQLINEPTHHTRKAIDKFPWAIRFTNIDVNEKVNLFNKTIKNVIRNYIPHETITCDDRNPLSINKNIKELIHDKNQAYKSYRQNKNNIFFVHQFELLQSKLNSLIVKTKSNYYARLFKKLSDQEAVAQRCPVKKVFLEISQNSQENSLFFNKETLAQVFSCQF